MLVIRMQRTGRRGHAQFRVVVQDSRFSPTSGRVVAYVGNYNPHTKESKLDVEKISQYLANGAQPSPRVVSLLSAEKVKLSKWVAEPVQKQRAVRNPEKRRSTAPEKPAEVPVEAPATESEDPTTEAEGPVEEKPAEATETPAEEKPAEATEAPAEETSQAEAPAETPAEPEQPVEAEPETAPEPEAPTEQPAEPETPAES